ncbi:SMP-30/gluconolactonase/LRE family protein [Jatrophihabitans fulvus]
MEQVTAPEADFGEAPVWLPGQGGLVWVDQGAGDVLRLTPDGAVERWHVGERAAFVRPRRDGGLVIALARSIAFADDWGAPVTVGPPLWTERDVVLNDGGCAPDGALWAGSAATDFAGARCALLRITGGRATTVVRDVGLSNGIAWSPDGAHAYWTDTLTRRVDILETVADGGVRRRPFVTIEDGAGYPDGLTVDADGRVWVALWDGAAVRCYEPDGTLADVVRLPVRQVTACCFGGPDLDELYVTTKRDGHRADEGTTAGAVFRERPGARGLPVAEAD